MDLKDGVISVKFGSDNTIFASVFLPTRIFRHCERGVWAAVRNFFGMNFAINVNSTLFGKERVYVSKAQVREVILSREPGFNFGSTRKTHQALVTILKGQAYFPENELAMLLDKLKRDSSVWETGVPDYLKYDQNFLKLAVGANYAVLEKYPDLARDRNFLLAVVVMREEVFLKVPFRDEREFQFEAIIRNARILKWIKFCSPKEEKDFLLRAIKENPHLYTDEAFPEELRMKKDFQEAWETAKKTVWPPEIVQDIL